MRCILANVRKSVIVLFLSYLDSMKVLSQNGVLPYLGIICNCEALWMGLYYQVLLITEYRV